MNHVTHVLLAGDKDYAPFMLEGRNNSLLDLSGRLLIEFTIDAFSSTTLVDKLVIVGPVDLSSKIPSRIRNIPTTFLPQQNSLSENVAAALDLIHERWAEDITIFVTNDAPLLTGFEIDGFAATVLAEPLDIHIATRRIESDLLSDPLVKQYVQSLVALSDGTYLLANQIALSYRSRGLVRTIQQFFDLRKQSTYAAFSKTLIQALKQPSTRASLIPWLRLVIAKSLWSMWPGARLNRVVGLSPPQVETGLEQLIGDNLRIRISEIPDALGCFDADTAGQLQELRKLIATQTEAIRKLEVAHA
jgi:hypothetical protein